MKYHVNTKTGETGECGAVKGKCPFGSESEHYTSRKAAQAAYEHKMEGATLPAISKTPAEVLAARETLQEHKADLAYMGIADKIMIDALLLGKKISDSKLDLYILNNQPVDNGYASVGELQALSAAITIATAERSKSTAPSTLVTLENFDPVKNSMFSNRNARKSAVVAGKALRREQAHAEWMRELAARAEEVAADPDFNSDYTKQQLLNAAAEQNAEANRSDARVRAQLKEIQYLFDRDPVYAATANNEVNHLLRSGTLKNQVSQLDSLPLGEVRKA